MRRLLNQDTSTHEWAYCVMAFEVSLLPYIFHEGSSNASFPHTVGGESLDKIVLSWRSGMTIAILFHSSSEVLVCKKTIFNNLLQNIF